MIKKPKRKTAKDVAREATTNLKYSYTTKWCQDYHVVYLNLFRSSHQRSSTGVCKKTEKVFLEISHKIHKEAPVLESLF